ncbi:MAG: EI24 domain-containing protein [Fimbriimonadales bacterium]
MGPFVRGFTYISRNPKLWAYAWGPVIATVLLYVGLLVFLQVSIKPIIDRLAPDSGLWSSLPVVGGVVLFLIWLVAANFIVIAISSLFSGLLWGKLSHTVEKDIFGDAPDVRVGCLPQVKDFLWRLLQAAIAVIALIMLGWLGMIASAVVSGLMGLVEFSAPAYARRGAMYLAQLRVLRLRAALGFVVCTGLVSLLPLVFVLAMPAMVVGGTILCREGEKPS